MLWILGIWAGIFAYSILQQKYFEGLKKFFPPLNDPTVVRRVDFPRDPLNVNKPQWNMYYNPEILRVNPKSLPIIQRPDYIKANELLYKKILLNRVVSQHDPDITKPPKNHLHVAFLPGTRPNLSSGETQYNPRVLSMEHTWEEDFVGRTKEIENEIYMSNPLRPLGPPRMLINGKS
jgi:hypothetical protein